MTLRTTFRFKNNSEITINHPTIIQGLMNDSTASSIWPSSILLILFLQQILQENSSKTILELGAGLGLTALVTMKLCNLKKYIMQELPDPATIETLTKNLCDLNPSQFEIVSGLWSDQDLITQISKFKEIDYLVMSDCFYNKKCFPHLLATISAILNNCTSIGQVFCIYHHRNVSDSIIKYLKIFDLYAEIVKISPSLISSIDKFKEMNPDLTQGKLLDFDELFIIEFKKINKLSS